MNKFDKQQVEFLKPLLKHDVVLHFSFYANTFPIAYHYNLLLEDFNKNNPASAKTISDFIKPHSWNEDFPSKSDKGLYEMRKAMNDNSNWEYPKSINLFYTSDIKYQTTEFQKYNPLKLILETSPVKDGMEKIEPFLFSKYTPRFVFLNNNLFTQKLTKPAKEERFTIDSTEFKKIENIKPQYYSLTEILSKAKSDEIENICVYTETINEARDIFEDYDEWKEKVIYYDYRKIDSLKLDDTSKNESKSLDIYFYGAPTSFLFLKRKKRFLPVLLDKANIAIETKVIVHSNFKDKKHSPEIIKLIKASVEFYHKNLYEIANSLAGEEFLNNIRFAYNKYARLTRSDSYFFTPESFTNCIALHNEYGEQESAKRSQFAPIAVASSNEIKKKNIHVHYGAGKLGIGLVLPLIKPDKNANNQLIVIQKNRDEWNKKVKTDLRRITLSNSSDWEIEFELKKLNESAFDISSGADFFLLYEDLKQTKDLLSQATSISYSLNNQKIEKEILSLISEVKFEKAVLLFPFENKPFGMGKTDKENKEFLDAILKNNPNIKYIKLKADRICLERNFDSDNQVKVACENHIEVVLNIDETKTNSLFDASMNKDNQLIFTEDLERYRFLSDRKEYLVNELHFILAVNGYDFLLSKGITHWENQFVTIIQSALTSDSKYKIPIDTFIRLQIIRLLHSSEYPRAVLKDVYNLEEENVEMIYEHLLKYAKGVTERFNASKEDQISRVFNTNDEKAIERKYKTIIEVIEKFVSERKTDIENIPTLSAGTYLEYKELTQDIKNKIENIFYSRIKNFHSQVASKQKEQIEKRLELESFDSKVKALTKKNENVLVLFDVDGTIFKAKEIFLPAIKTVLFENNITDFSDVTCLKFVGMPYNEIEDALQKLILKTSYKQFKSRLQQLELDNIKHSGELFEGVIDTLKTLKQNNYTLAICTNARKEYINTIIEKFNLSRFFKSEDILFPEKFPPPSDKQTMLKALKNRINPFKCFMIGDRYYDSEAAKKNGFEFIGARYGYANDEIKNETKYLIDEIKSILSIIQIK